MTKLSVLPTELVEKLLDMALMSACTDADNQVCSEVSMLLDAKPSEVTYEEGVYADFYLYSPLLQVHDLTRDESGAFVNPHTAYAFQTYCDMMVMAGQELLAVKDSPNEFFRAMGETLAALKPAPETAQGFERAFDLLTRLDPSMPLSQVMVWLREFLSGSRDADIALTAAEGRWIPVSAGLPPKNVFLIASDAEWEHSKRRGEAAPMKIGYLEREGKWKLFGASWTPTHWMLMPPPVVVHPKPLRTFPAHETVN